jgi:hypothetical protein
VDAKAIWLLSPSSLNHIFILASFSANTSSYIWDGSVVDLDQNVAISLSASGRYLTSSCAAYASYSFIGSQDILFLGTTDTQFIYRYDALITQWIPLSSFATPASLSTSIVIRDPYSFGAVYMSVFAAPDKGVRAFTANVSISQGADFVKHLQHCDNSWSLFVLRSLHALDMNEAISVVSWFNVSSGIPELVAELSNSDSMSLLESHSFAVDCQSGCIGIAHSKGISLVIANFAARSIQVVSSKTPASSIFGDDLISVSSMIFASIPQHLPILVFCSRIRGGLNSLILSGISGSVRFDDGSTFRDGQKYLTWLTRSSSPVVSAPMNRSLPLWNKGVKSFYSFSSYGRTYVVLLGKCNDPLSATPAFVLEQVRGDWIFRQELPNTRGSCVASACEHIPGKLSLLIGINAFGDIYNNL